VGALLKQNTRQSLRAGRRADVAASSSPTLRLLRTSAAKASKSPAVSHGIGNETDRTRGSEVTLRPVRGLSARSVESTLSLPDGAWKSRRLVALRVQSDSLSRFGVHHGDYLIVEPGAQANLNRLVVIRDGSVIGLRRVRLDAMGRCILCGVDPEALPFEQTSGKRGHVIGRVIAVLPQRRTHNGTPLRFLERHPSGTQRGAARAPAVSEQYRSQPIKRRRFQGLAAREETLLGTLRRWARWAERRLARSDGVEAPRLDNLGRRLRTLVACIEKADEPHLRSALIREAESTARVIAGCAGDGRRIRDVGVFVEDSVSAECTTLGPGRLDRP
jgi:hypothetical protein